MYFHYSPTRTSWLNEIECWFNILTSIALKRPSFTSPQQVHETIDKSIDAHNKNATPSEWRKRKVFPVDLKRNYSNSCN